MHYIADSCNGKSQNDWSFFLSSTGRFERLLCASNIPDEPFVSLLYLFSKGPIYFTKRSVIWFPMLFSCPGNKVWRTILFKYWTIENGAVWIRRWELREKNVKNFNTILNKFQKSLKEAMRDGYWFSRWRLRGGRRSQWWKVSGLMSHVMCWNTWVYKCSTFLHSSMDASVLP